MTDVVCLGESLAVFRPSEAGTSLAAADRYVRGAGGAESNVAGALAGAGHTVHWVSRLGADAFGDTVLRTVSASGVETAAVRRDPERPTGVYFRTDGDRGHDLETAYYRAGSAASAMSPRTLPVSAVPSSRVLHLTGVTAALSEGCRELLRELTGPRPGRPLISFDVNHRPQLWRRPGQAGGEDCGRILGELARASDLVFVGEDEAEAVWGVTGGPAAIRAALPEPETVVVKGLGHDAVLLSGGRTVTVPAPRVDVAAPVGAGDAFAAGYLSALLTGQPEATRLRYGHLFAAAVLAAVEDHAPPPPADVVRRLAALPDDAWADLRLGPGWTAREAQPDTARTDTARPDTARPDTARPDTARTDTARTDPAAAPRPAGAPDPSGGGNRDDAPDAGDDR